MLSCSIFSELEGEDYVDYVPITNTEPSRHITVKFILKTMVFMCFLLFSFLNYPDPLKLITDPDPGGAK